MTSLLIFLNTVAFVGEVLTDGALTMEFALWPPHANGDADGGIGFAPWQLLTYGFLHANPAHLAFNMLGVLMFGRSVEGCLGPGRMLAIYLASLVSAGLTQLTVLGYIAPAHMPTIGASGAVFGLLLAYARLFPRRIVVLLFPPIPMPAWLFATVYAVLELFLGLSDTRTGIAHFAHLGGMAASALLLWQWHVRAEAQS
ncbi:rhomboid family intramembrane serine protease [Cupriavidus sp. WKF15]|uniref:rhomboid family intramembrane serine protease n=1 Tax=Cupriavidus sp. WKF15 TaxID=3032282 RepID=UPI0023E2870B|nr:rhomboid family intramembrane serine protease [Cupriavidus sp. WKF15]WER44697.1 rhomboid family intramembrane serine protease [Cupriavidus sp. WKF15]